MSSKDPHANDCITCEDPDHWIGLNYIPRECNGRSQGCPASRVRLVKELYDVNFNYPKSMPKCVVGDWLPPLCPGAKVY